MAIKKNSDWHIVSSDLLFLLFRRPAIYFTLGLSLLLGAYVISKLPVPLPIQPVAQTTARLQPLPQVQLPSQIERNAVPCSGIVQRIVLTKEPIELNPGGNCYHALHEDISGQCVNVFDRWGTYLGNDCGATTVVSFEGKYAARFSAANADTVQVTYVLCSHRGVRGIVADGCP